MLELKAAKLVYISCNPPTQVHGRLSQAGAFPCTEQDHTICLCVKSCAEYLLTVHCKVQ